MLYKLTKKRNGSHAYCKPGKLAGISISHLKKFLIDSKRFVYLRQGQRWENNFRCWENYMEKIWQMDLIFVI